jgi:hypothetical protein
MQNPLHLSFQGNKAKQKHPYRLVTVDEAMSMYEEAYTKSFDITVIVPIMSQ